MNDPRFLIGIDLGTTNSACAFVDLHGSDTPRPRLFRIPQVVAPGEVEARDTLPSFVYYPQDAESAGVVGEYAREQGSLAPARQVSSAKSWLCHPAVDRTAAVLPWGADPPFVSPVEASTRILTHVRDAWNESMSAGKDEWRMERQPIVLTVPASFDEEARELTLEAARAAGLQQLTLVEEPLAAFYAWIESHPSALRVRKRKGRAAPGRDTKNGIPLAGNDLVLVCDVGGGTSDFTLIRVDVAGGELTFDRTAVGEHLLLGGDNLDLALARLLESKLGASSLSLVQRLALRRSAAAAKERLLSGASTDRVAVTVLGSGRSVVGGALTTELTRDQVVGALLEGFLPLVDRDAAPVRDRHAALREMGLPYADDPAITRHLAAFLRTAADPRGGDRGLKELSTQDVTLTAEGQVWRKAPALRLSAILFNGGFFTPAIARERVLENLAHWYAGEEEWRPQVLENANPAAAVALGAAAYAHARRGGGLRIHAGSARSYYIGLGGEDAGRAVCILPRGTEEGSSFSLGDRAFAVMTNRPVSFPLFSSTTRSDALGVIVAAADAGLHAHAPLSSVLRFGKKTRQVDLEVGLAAMYTETGTLQVECTSRSTDHRWRLQFFARESAAPPQSGESDADQAHAFVADERLTAARAALAGVFGETGAIPFATPEDLPGQLEATLGFGRPAWPVEVIRALADTLLTMAGGRRKGPRYEARWLNLLGFCLRPGFGAPLDDWRVNQARSLYVEGLAFPSDLQCQVEWIVLWQRVAGGLKAGQQRDLYQRYATVVDVRAGKRLPRANAQVQREAWRLLASLERLAAAERVKLGDTLLSRIAKDPGNASYLWALGRFGARTPAYGAVTAVIPPDRAEAWLERLLALKKLTSDAASAIAEIGGRSDDPLRDIPGEARVRAIECLAAAGFVSEAESMREIRSRESRSALQAFGEALPAGLRLVSGEKAQG